MEHLIYLIKKRKEIGSRPAYSKSGNHNDLVEHERLGQLIIEEVNRLYEEGKLEEKHGQRDIV